MRFSTTTRLARAATAVGVIATLASMSAMGTVADKTPPKTNPHPVKVTPVRGKMRPLGVVTQPQATTMDAGNTLNCQTAKATYHCYLPQQLDNAYDVQPLLNRGDDGSGQTVAIIDAYQNPTMASDMASFDKVTGLGAPKLSTIAPFGLTPFDSTDPNQVGWSSEIALDVEWVHAMAPKAKIVLALAPTNSDPDLIATTKFVVDHNLADVVSQSYAEAEQCMAPQDQQDEHVLFQRGTAKGITFVAGTGDVGAAQYSCDGNSYVKSSGLPASDPNVTAVGGTTLHADLPSGSYDSESVWNEPGQGGAGGGGFSGVYERPSYQNGVIDNNNRGVPDVAMDASNYWGVLVSWGSSGTSQQFWSFSGTSIGGPIWSGLFAIADQMAGKDLGNVNAALYKLGKADEASKDKDKLSFNDVTTGNNNCGFCAPKVTGYKAGDGWDAATGWGSPLAGNLLPRLAASGGGN